MKPYFTLACIAAILYLVLMPSTPQVPELMLFEGADKVVHACMMGGLVVCVAFDRWRARLLPAVRPVLVAALWIMAFGVFTEELQQAMPVPRTADALDVVADWAGTLAASGLVLLSARALGRRCGCG